MKFVLSLSLSFLFLLTAYAAYGFTEKGKASYYSDKYHGRKTASGVSYDKEKLTAAHKTLPFGTLIQVTRLDNGKSVIVKVNDRGPFTKGYVVDLSRKAAVQIGLIKDGITEVEVKVVQNSKLSAEAATAPNPRVKVIKPLGDTQEAKAKKINGRTGRGAIDTKQVNMEKEGLYKIQVLKMAKKGFGVQIASFSSYDSVLKQVASLQEKWFKNVLVLATYTSGSKQYKIILGPFNDRSTANSYKESVKTKHDLEGFIVDLDSF